MAAESNKVGTIDSILKGIAKDVVMEKPEHQKIHEAMLLLYRHCFKMSFEETRADDVFSFLTSTPWLGLS